jgi:hypothetical protein
MKKQNLNEELDRIKKMMGSEPLNESRYRGGHSYRDMEDDDDNEPPMCSSCNGTGEGSTPDTTCWSCKGSGVEKIERDDYDNYDFDSDYSSPDVEAKMWGGIDESELKEQPVNPKKYTYKGEGPSNMTTKMVSSPVTLGAGLFLNGVDKIDKSSQEYQTGLKKIEGVSKQKSGNFEVTVVGGASAVGSPSYDNEGLARRRAQNFINSVQGNFPNVKFTISTKVGKATTKNSPEANAEQFVKLNFIDSSLKSNISPAIDNTAAVFQNIKPIVKKVKAPNPTEEKVTVCFEIPTSRLKYINWLVSTLGGVKK